MSLRFIHLMFVLICMVAADVFGSWALWQHVTTPKPSLLVFGILSFAAGFGLVVYAIWFVHKSDRMHLE